MSGYNAHGTQGKQRKGNAVVTGNDIEMGRFVFDDMKTDDHRFAMLLLDEFRSGAIGRISLERPGDGASDETADQETDGI